MQKAEVIAKLQQFADRLKVEVINAFAERGSEFGNERFSAWRRQLSKFLDEALPGESSKLDSKLEHFVFSMGSGESDVDVFWRMDGKPSLAFLDSLIIDVKNDEFHQEVKPIPKIEPKAAPSKPSLSSKVFIVHGHDELIKTQAARFLEKLGFEAIILHEQASRGMTIIEKIEAYTDVGFAIVLYTPDDLGNAKGIAEKELNERARQNVVFEHGYLIARLGRERVVPLISGRIEKPSDISGVVYIEDSNWQVEIAKEMKGAGFEIDFNRLL